jgi:PKD repeat protein
VEAQFVFAQQSPCTPFYIDLTNTSLNGNTFHWYTVYNGDTLTNNKNPFSYLFDNTTPNTILTDTIKLVSLDAATGCTDSTYRTLTIYPRVVSNFDVDKVQGCNPLTVNFTNNSSGLGTYLWEFGDGATSANDTPDPHSYSHPYKDQSVNYTAKLTATNAFGCKSYKDTAITVYPLVKPLFQWIV